ncbi:hypothetical protein SAY86_029461 [Trapa natans]|uniref:Uncharacterized protein n=1 Tax=Trapa natans TaxID=22666 RepID=A0AAN7RD11_TRANT|nr:hypothetical protein SAY86_029461 [Trapa natans]
MDEAYSIVPSTTTVVLIISLFALSISFYYKSSKLTSPQSHDLKTAPEAGGAWPLFGHLHLLDGPKPVHLVLAEMADKYGPIFTIRLGVHRAIVVSTSEVAKDCLTTCDRTFATRPSSVGSEVLAYNYAMIGFSPYDPYWRYIRKIAVVELLSNHRMNLLRHVRESEVFASVRTLYEKYYRNGTESVPLVVDMKRWFGDITVNVVFRMVVGRRFTDEDEGEVEKGKQALQDLLDLIGRFVVSDGLPFLRWLDLGGHEKAMKRTAVEADWVVQRWLEEHKLSRRSKLNGEEARGTTSDQQQDFMDVMLSIIKDDEGVESYDADTVIKAVCLNLILGGFNTTLVTLTWALSLLLNHKETLQKAQQELDAQVGKDRRIRESDLKNLPYLNAIIKEALRLYPAAPLSVVHEATEDCTVSGYFVQKGTRLILNFHKIHHDPRAWPDASEFRPERFLTTHKDIDVRGQSFELIPFGSGRRMCPGVTMALQVIGLALGSFLHAFEVATPGDEAVDMEEAMGLTNLKASPLEVLVTPRVPEHVYI